MPKAYTEHQSASAHMTEQKQQEATTMTEHWPNGRVREIRRGVNGKRHGRQQVWYEGGQPRYDHSYEHGVEHGRLQGWYENGQPWYDQNYERGEKHGRQRRWYSGGQPKYDSNYEHGQQHGRQQAWHEDGRPWYDSNYEHGTEYGREAAAGIETPTSSHTTSDAKQATQQSDDRRPA